VLYDHYNEFIEDSPVDWRWQNFSPKELSCPHCGEFYFFPAAFDAIQRLRDIVGAPVNLNSAHRCPIHNAHVGGAPLSEHKTRIAFDINLSGRDRLDILNKAAESGFGTFGFYRTFLHADMRPGRRWFGKGARSLWNL